MTDPEALGEALDLADRAQVLMLTTLDGNGYPETRAMLAMGHDALNEFWFSTNTSSHKVAQIQADVRACVYVVDDGNFQRLSLVGRVEVRQDPATKERFWREGFEKYYPQGVTDPDYAVLRFTAERGEYYHGLRTAAFDLRSDEGKSHG